jgi:hypothetical protein
MKRPAYSSAFLARVASGQPVSLVVLALDWNAGRLLTDRLGVCRLVVANDVPVADLDLSILRGFNVLVMGGEEDAFYASQRLALAFGAASVWAEFDNGVWRVESCRAWPCVVAIESVKDADALLRFLPAFRDARLLMGEGAYAAPSFREARIALFGVLFGNHVAERLRARATA